MNKNELEISASTHCITTMKKELELAVLKLCGLLMKCLSK